MRPPAATSESRRFRREGGPRGFDSFQKFIRRLSLMKIAGIILIILGVLALAYQGIRYTTREKLIDIGPLNVTTTERKTIPLPPIVGGAAVIAGIALILADRKNH
jgi:hypothetical protein